MYLYLCCKHFALNCATLSIYLSIYFSLWLSLSVSTSQRQMTFDPLSHLAAPVLSFSIFSIYSCKRSALFSLLDVTEHHSNKSESMDERRVSQHADQKLRCTLLFWLLLTHILQSCSPFFFIISTMFLINIVFKLLFIICSFKHEVLGRTQQKCFTWFIFCNIFHIVYLYFIGANTGE